MIEDYCNTSLLLRKKQSYGFNGQINYSDDTPIKVMLENKVRMVRDKTGKEVKSETTIFCFTEVNVDDVIKISTKPFTVIWVKEIRRLDGEIEYYEVAL